MTDLGAMKQQQKKQEKEQLVDPNKVKSDDYFEVVIENGKPVQDERLERMQEMKAFDHIQRR